MEIARLLRDIDRKEAMESYEELKAAPPPQEATMSRVGLKTLDYFFLHHRIKTKTRHRLSFYDALQDPVRVRHLNELVRRYKKTEPRSLSRAERLRLQYQVFQLYYGTINQFRPMIAKWIYHRFKPQVGILDFSAGWGGRLLAAMSMGIPYTGIDANTKLEASYRQMVEACQPDAPVHMHFMPAETVAFGRLAAYDLIFTSPPYFMIEEYEKMPAYGSKQAFLDRFFIPVVQKAWDHLQPGGKMVLNMPEEMYEVVAPLLPSLQHRLALPLSNRHPTNAKKGQALGTEDTSRHEWIYVWHKRRG
jgi:hypothetical protein